MLGQCSKCTEFCLNKVSIFKNLENSQKIDILKKIEHKKFKKGDVIFNEGDDSKSLFFISYGRMKLYKYTTDGKEQIISILSEGDFYGELDILKKSQYRVNASAITDCKICTITSRDFKELMTTRPELALAVIESLTERLTDAESLVRSLATNDIDARIAYLLSSLIDKYGEKVGDTIEIEMPLSREDMANYIGVARETISRKLKKFEKDGIIKLQGTKKIIILDQGYFYDYI